MSTYFSLEPLVVGIFPAFPLARFLHGCASDEPVAAPCISWLACGSDGTIVLVDTGPPVPTVHSERIHQGLEVRPEHRIDAALAARGVAPDEIRTVILTHLHFDHCAHMDALPNARFLVQREEIQYAVAPRAQHRTGYEVGYENILPGWMKAFDRIETLEGSTQISDGCAILALPGHTPGSQGVVFRTRKGRCAAVGDLVNVVENWEGRGPGDGHIPPALHYDLDACNRSFSTLEREADVVLASHDFRMVSEYGRG